MTVPPDQEFLLQVAPFIRQLRVMLDEGDPSILGWNADGSMVEIRDVPRLTQLVLPRYFRHGRYASFQRQLNYFSFHRSARERGVRIDYWNPLFHRDHPRLMCQIQRKAPRRLPRARQEIAAASREAIRQLDEEAIALSELAQSHHLDEAIRITPRDVEPRSVENLAAYEPTDETTSDVLANCSVVDSTDWIDALFASVQGESPRGVEHVASFEETGDDDLALVLADLGEHPAQV